MNNIMYYDIIHIIDYSNLMLTTEDILFQSQYREIKINY